MVVSQPPPRLQLDLPESVVAVPVARRDSAGNERPRLDRRGRHKLDEVEVVAAESAAAAEMVFDEAERQFVLGAVTRSWGVIARRYGNAALSRCFELVAAGVVTLRCPLDDHLHLGKPRSWRLTEEWATRRHEAVEGRAADRTAWRQRAAAAAAAVSDISPELAVALHAAQPLAANTPVLVFAAEDLACGFVNDGPRAFSQRHFGHTKERDDVAHVLRTAGVSVDTLKRLGVQRSGRIGVAGPITVSAASGSFSASAFDGPQLLRTDQPDLQLALERPVPLVLIENLQAAETVADQYDDIAIVYGAGYAGPAALRLIEGLAAQATRVLLIPDADADGAAIASKWLSAAPVGEVVDIGETEHDATPALAGWARRKLTSQLSGPAGAFAQAILDRGYPLEEEMLVVRALRSAL